VASTPFLGRDTDPTMGVELFQKAGVLIWPIVALSVIGVALTVHRLVFFWFADRHNRAVVDRVVPLVERDRIADAAQVCASGRGPVARVLAGLFDAWSLAEDQKKALVTVAAERQLREVEWGLRFLAIIARVAPLLGLLGTVVGLVEAFIAFSSEGGQPSPTLLADGIWKALLTTVAGLTVAIPAIFAHEWCAARADAQAFSMKEAVARVDGSRSS